MEDYILRATAGNGSVRAFAAYTKNTVEQARQVHNTSPVATAALGRLLTAGAIMGTMLKGEKELLTLQIKGDGPMQGLLVTSDYKARVKGYVYQPEVENPLLAPGKLDVGGAIGNGQLTVIKDIGMKEPYVGQIGLCTGEIGDDLTNYFATSEQTPSAVGLGVLIDVDRSVKQSGGFIIQLMPDADEDVIAKIEKNIAKITSVTELLEEGNNPEGILKILLGDNDLTVLDKIPVEFYCNCTRERVEKALISIGKKDLKEILEQDKEAKLHCHFCNREYVFNEDDLKSLIQNI